MRDLQFVRVCACVCMQVCVCVCVCVCRCLSDDYTCMCETYPRLIAGAASDEVTLVSDRISDIGVAIRQKRRRQCFIRHFPRVGGVLSWWCPCPTSLTALLTSGVKDDVEVMPRGLIPSFDKITRVDVVFDTPRVDASTSRV